MFKASCDHHNNSLYFLVPKSLIGHFPQPWYLELCGIILLDFLPGSDDQNVIWNKSLLDFLLDLSLTLILPRKIYIGSLVFSFYRLFHFELMFLLWLDFHMRLRLTYSLALAPDWWQNISSQAVRLYLHSYTGKGQKNSLN